MSAGPAGTPFALHSEMPLHCARCAAHQNGSAAELLGLDVYIFLLVKKHLLRLFSICLSTGFMQ